MFLFLLAIEFNYMSSVNTPKKTKKKSKARKIDVFYNNFVPDLRVVAVDAYLIHSHL